MLYTCSATLHVVKSSDLLAGLPKDEGRSSLLRREASKRQSPPSIGPDSRSFQGTDDETNRLEPLPLSKPTAHRRLLLRTWLVGRKASHIKQLAKRHVWEIFNRGDSVQNYVCC